MSGYVPTNPKIRASDERIREAARTKSPKQLEREAEDAARDAETVELLRRDTVECRPARRAT